MLTITITFVARPYVRIGEEMPDFVIKLEFRKPLDQDTLDLAAFRVPMLGVYLAGERQSYESFYFCREIPGCFRRAAYIDGNLFAPSKHVVVFQSISDSFQGCEKKESALSRGRRRILSCGPRTETTDAWKRRIIVNELSLED